MKEALTATTLFGTVVMARQGSNALLLVTEGRDDHFALSQHIDDRHLVLIAGTGGKENVLHAAALTEERDVQGVRFLVDADYDLFVGGPRNYPANVILSDYHDVMIDLVIGSPVLLNRVIDSHSRAARSAGSTFSTDGARGAAFELASSIAPIRIINERESLQLNLRDFPFGSLNNLRPTPLELATIAIGRSPSQMAPNNLAGKVDVETSHRGVTNDRLCGDHDFFRALARVLKEHRVMATPEALFNSFLAGMLCEHLAACGWHRDIVSWATQAGVSAFRCPCAV